jgi:hypothetical protein
MDRRRNVYAAACCICGNNVPPNEGWLYQDTRRHRRNGRFASKIKCARCHEHNLTHAAQVRELENPAPKIRRWSVNDVDKWTLKTETHIVSQARQWQGEGKGYEWVETPVITVHLVLNGESVQLAGEGFLGAQTDLSSRYELEWRGIGGRPFTSAAWRRLGERVSALLSR